PGVGKTEGSRGGDGTARASVRKLPAKGNQRGETAVPGELRFRCLHCPDAVFAEAQVVDDTDDGVGESAGVTRRDGEAEAALPDHLGHDVSFGADDWGLGP